jgi:hypothetical protein
LVPVKNNPKDGSPLDMGQIDSEKCIPMSWNGIGVIVTEIYIMIQKLDARVSLTEQILPINGSIDCGESLKRQNDYWFGADKMP